jgi:hypothetical protein
MGSAAAELEVLACAPQDPQNVLPSLSAAPQFLQNAMIILLSTFLTFSARS